MHQMSSQAEFSILYESGVLGRTIQPGHFHHLDNHIGVWNYIRIANEIVEQLPQGHLLDWGCGAGQMTYLLRQRGLQVTAYDIRDETEPRPAIPLNPYMSQVFSQEAVTLPFAPQSFNAALSCGVLEHVDEFSEPGNEVKSLREIWRVLKPGGTLFIYQLPQRYAWQETIIRAFELGYSHPRRYTVDEITSLLATTGFQVQHVRRANLIPKNLTGMPQSLRRFYSRFSHLLIALDGVLAQWPVLQHIAGVFEIVASKPMLK